jgi:hypothetical protein
MQKAPLISLMVTCLVAGCINGIEKPLQQAPKPTQTSSAGDQTSEVPLPLEQTAECMLKVLKTVPGVSEPRLGNVTTGGWTHPFLEYRAAEESRWIQPTRFDVQKRDDGHILFMAMLPGMSALDTHVTNVVVQEWKVQCGVAAIVILG